MSKTPEDPYDGLHPRDQELSRILEHEESATWAYGVQALIRHSARRVRVDWLDLQRWSVVQMTEPTFTLEDREGELKEVRMTTAPHELLDELYALARAVSHDAVARQADDVAKAARAARSGAPEAFRELWTSVRDFACAAKDSGLDAKHAQVPAATSILVKLIRAKRTLIVAGQEVVFSTKAHAVWSRIVQLAELRVQQPGDGSSDGRITRMSRGVRQRLLKHVRGLLDDPMLADEIFEAGPAGIRFRVAPEVV